MKLNPLLPALALFISATCPASTVSLETLLREITDRDTLARFPALAFTLKQFSSHDRASVSPDDPAGWFANRDCSWFLRAEKNKGRREFVMCDARGPGAIVRFWMTFAGPNAGRGTMRIYIDGDNMPLFEGSAFDILSGDLVSGPPLADSVSKDTPYENRGHDLYFPIPYAKSCKITYESTGLSEDDYGAKDRKKTEAVFYNINYRTYDDSVEVASLSRTELKKNKALVEKTLKQLSNGGRDFAPVMETLEHDTEISPGGTKAFVLDGPAAIRRLALRLSATKQEQALRSALLEIAFDGHRTVRVPVGDFFGIGYKQVATETWYATASEDGLMQAFWVMPFAKKCEITLRNTGTQRVLVNDFVVGTKPWAWDARSMHFGANWRQYTGVMAFPKEKAADVNFVTLEGRGVYVGDVLTLFNTNYHWWGEGDEKVYVDGEKFPSHFGTGSEDYYGYAWSRPEIFIGHPFIAQPKGAGAFSPGYVVNSRYRALDSIPFNKSLRFDMELWPHVRTLLNYAPTVFFYLMPGGETTAPDGTSAAAMPVALHRADLYPPTLNADLSIEGENLQWISNDSGSTLRWHTLDRPPPNMVKHTDNLPWSGGLQLAWQNIEWAGQRAVFAFISDKAGTFDLTGVFTTAPDYGTFNIHLNGKRIFSRLDLRSDLPDMSGHTANGVELKSGANVLEIELVRQPPGLNAKAAFGLDKLIFKPSTQ
jgi:hypothetical protein